MYKNINDLYKYLMVCILTFFLTNFNKSCKRRRWSYMFSLYICLYTKQNMFINQLHHHHFSTGSNAR